MSDNVLTHENYIHAIRQIVLPRVPSGDGRDLIVGAKMVYGHGGRKIRGVCHFNSWENGSKHDFVEICAASEESYIQIAGTTIHELGHVLNHKGGGHRRDWKQACEVLGLLNAIAKGMDYKQESFAPEVWQAIQTLGFPTDGVPKFTGKANKPGSRLRLYECACPVKVRVASDDFRAMCLECETTFKQPD